MQNTNNFSSHHPYRPYLIEMASYASYDSKRSLHDAQGVEGTDTVKTGMAQPAMSLHHHRGMTCPSPPNECHEEE